jgi:hypothetical protein
MQPKRKLPLKTALLVGSLTIAPVAFGNGVSTVYQETFPWTGTQQNPQAQDKELRNQGWCGGNAGDSFCNNPPSTAPGDPPNEGGEGAISADPGGGSTVTPSQNINNDPQGPLVTDSFAFWSQTRISAKSFLYTNEYSLQSSRVLSVSWDQRDSSDDPTHLAFCIDGQWHVSQDSWSNDSDSWANTAVDLAGLTFFVVGACSDTLPGGDINVAPGGPLPSGLITAFGFWWDSDKTGTSRVDNVRLIGKVDSVPALSPWAVVILAGLLAIIGMRRFVSSLR